MELVGLAIACLVGAGAISAGAPPEQLGSGILLALLFGLAAGGLAVVAKPARVPVGTSLLAISVVTAIGGFADLLEFYDSAGLGTTFGVASLVGVALILAGRRTQLPWF